MSPDSSNPATPPVPAAPTEPPVHQHSVRMTGIARGLGIERPETLDDAALRREIADAQLEFQLAQARQQSHAPPPPSSSVPEPDEEFVIPPELQGELADAPPGVLKLI